MNIIFSFLALFLALPLKETIPSTVATSKIPDHTLWSKELDKYVSDEGLVNYATWKENQDNLDQYLHFLSGPLPLSNWSQNVQLAYWINLHNAYTIKLVLDHYPINSLTEIFKGKALEEVWITLGESHFSLELIQHEIRNQFNEPQAHFALNYATRASAPLLNTAYSPEQLNEQLHAQTASFINNTSFNQVSDSTALLSHIFSTYEEDFKPDILSYIQTFLVDTMEEDLRLEFFEVDWAINDQSSK